MEITFYGKENCPKCDNAKRVLAERNVSYVLNLIGKDIEREDFIVRYPQAKTVPFFVVDDLDDPQYKACKAWAFSDVYSLMGFLKDRDNYQGLN